MKRKDLLDLKTKTIEELSAILSALSDELSSLKIEMVGKKLKNTNVIKLKKKEIARVLTFITLKKYALKEAVKEEK